MRAFKTVNDSYIEPISFIVPRRAEVFQDDIYPPPVGSKPAMSAAEWFDGKVALPPKIDLASVYAGEEAKEVPSDFQPATINITESSSPSLVSKANDREDDQPSMPVAKGPPPSMIQQTSSIKNLAKKFNDAEEGDEDDASSFEDVSKPSERSTQQVPLPVASPIEVNNPSAISEHPDEPLATSEGKHEDLGPAIQQMTAQSKEQPNMAQQGERSTLESAVTSKQPTTGNTGPGQSGLEGNEVKQSLAEIMSLLEKQVKTMDAQNETIGRLTAEVDRLRSKMDAS